MAHTLPTVAELQARYPAFASVADATIQAYIDDASTQRVDTTWTEADYGPAIMAFAAHQMTLLEIGKQSELGTFARAGVDEIKSGQFTGKLNSGHVSRSSGGGLKATPYGRQYETLLNKNKGGPRVVTAPARATGYGPTGQLNDGTLLP